MVSNTIKLPHIIISNDHSDRSWLCVSFLSGPNVDRQFLSSHLFAKSYYAPVTTNQCHCLDQFENKAFTRDLALRVIYFELDLDHVVRGVKIPLKGDLKRCGPSI